jgi:2-methylisocitrate lyase-like PEP mutase family enzyme
MTTPARRFLDLHVPGSPLLLPNPWDVGSAKILESLGFAALATTSSGFAATLGRPDMSVTRDEAIAHAAAVVAAVDVPVSADLENGFGDEPAAVTETVRRAIDAGLAGCSIEDSTGRPGEPVYDLPVAAERIAAAAAAAGNDIVLTARAENHLYGRTDLNDTIARLQAYAQAGAHVLYAPGITDADDLRTLVAAVDRPVNVLALPGVPPVAELAELGVARVSIGGAFAFAAYGALAEAGRELLDRGSYDFLTLTKTGRSAAGAAFAD